MVTPPPPPSPELIVRSLLEIAGLACIVAAVWLVHPLLGLATLGVALMLAANFAGRSQR